MAGYIIYGKVLKPFKNGNHMFEPQATFRALSHYGVRVTKLKDAEVYETKELAQLKINKVMAFHNSKGHGDCVAFEIRKAK